MSDSMSTQLLPVGGISYDENVLNCFTKKEPENERFCNTMVQNLSAKCNNKQKWMTSSNNCQKETFNKLQVDTQQKLCSLLKESKFMDRGYISKKCFCLNNN